MHKTRLALLSLAFLVYTVSLGVIWLQRLDFQVIALGIVFAMCLVRIGALKTWKQIKLILPFALSMAVVYTALILLKVAPKGQNAGAYWLHYGGSRMMLLVSSLLVFRFCISLLSYQGLMLASSNIHWQKYLILGKILYYASFRSLPKIRYWHSLIPSAQIQPKGIKIRFQRALALSLALSLHIMEQARQKGNLIDNRIQNSHKE